MSQALVPPVPSAVYPRGRRRNGNDSLNLLAEGCCGCHIVDRETSWIIGASVGPSDGAPGKLSESFAESKEGHNDDDLVMYRVVEDEERELGILEVYNCAPHARACYVSASWACTAHVTFWDRHDSPLKVGCTLRGRSRAPCVTFVLILQANERIQMASLDLGLWRAGVVHLWKMSFKLDANIYEQESANEATVPLEFDTFPLAGNGPWLCTQGFGGRLTHFFPESYHAVDFRCPVGTPVLAVADGTITEIQQHNTVTGIHCMNLGLWNSVTLSIPNAVSGGTDIWTVDYVHIAPGSVKFRVGDKVKAGDTIALSGEVGFAPEPHLHLEVHLASDPMGSSVPFRLRRAVANASTPAAKCDGEAVSERESYIPEAGEWYGPCGRVDVKSSAMQDV
eukprot:TRINITY_DN54360_c0_g1_i1.p1 TRINITY_DN54360_c0_g1~~TRINITY_DN54360_c0_g1_i1.p1  ORF type:complete len:394 (+),score=38.80 TRINITY_DN54360_c0_g1_i1:20-1201(+)